MALSRHSLRNDFKKFIFFRFWNFFSRKMRDAYDIVGSAGFIFYSLGFFGINFMPNGGVIFVKRNERNMIFFIDFNAHHINPIFDFIGMVWGMRIFKKIVGAESVIKRRSNPIAIFKFINESVRPLLFFELAKIFFNRSIRKFHADLMCRSASFVKGLYLGNYASQKT